MSRLRMVTRGMSGWSLTLFATMAFAQVPAQQAETAEAIAKEVRTLLDSCYEKRTQPDLESCFASLRSDSPKLRRYAGAMLHAMLVTSREDARRGHTPEREGMRLWSGPQEFDGELCWNVARGLAETTWPGDGAEAEPASIWLFRNSPRGDDRTNAMRALTRVRTPGANEIVREVVRGPHPNFAVLALGMSTAGDRGMSDLADAIAALRAHYRDDVRRAAASSARVLGRTDDVAEPVADVVPPTLVRWLELAARLVVEPVPPHAAWITATIPADEEQGRNEPYQIAGWLLDRRAGHEPELLLPFGRRVELRAGITTVPASLVTFAKDLLALRARYDESDMDEQRKIESGLGIQRFMRSSGEEWHGSAAEILVAAWLRERGEEALAAEIVLPLLAGADDEAEFFGGLLSDIASRLDEAMLEAFVVERDYARALEFARRLTHPECSFWHHQDRAIALAEQLPRRGDDFGARSLPTPEEWTRLQTKLSRREQIVFLLERLRLLNCMQWSNPGGVDYGDDQYREPLAARDFERLEASTEVINPFLTLLAMDPVPEELESLIPLLTSNDYILAFDIERFLPQRPQSLHRVQWVAGMLFNAAAREELADPRLLRGSEADRDAHLVELRGWCERMRGIGTADRLAQRLAAATDHTNWRAAFWQLREVDAVRADLGALEYARQHEERRCDVARLLVLLDSHDHADVARTWETEDGEELRLWARLALVRAGVEDSERVGAVLRALEETRDFEVVHAAVEALIACRDPRARAFLVGRLREKDAAVFVPSLAFAQRLMRAGFVEGFDSLASVIDDPAASPLRVNVASDGPLDRETVAWQLRQWCGPRSAQMGLGSEDPSVRHDALRRWLVAEWDAIQAGRASSMQVEGLAVPWGVWLLPGPGWVRRF